MALVWSPIYLDQFLTPKWIIFALCTFLSSYFLVTQDNIKFPRLSTFEALSLFLVLTGFTVSMSMNSYDTYWDQIRDWLGFLIILLATYNSAKKDKLLFLDSIHSWLLVSITLVMTGAVFQFLNWDLGGFLIPHKNLFSTFGNKNMAGEFVGIISIFNFLWLIQNFKNKYFSKKFWFTLITFIISLIYLANLFSKAVILGLSLGIFYSLLKLAKISVRLKIILSTISLTIVSATVITIFANSDLGNTESSISLRKIRWGNTVNMILDNPIGVGPNNYSFSYINYKKSFHKDPEVKESSIVKSPHNGFLELGSEYGLLTLFGLLGLIFLFSFRFVNSPRTTYAINLISPGILILVLIDSVFAFPMELPFPLMLTAFSLGLFLIDYPLSKENSLKFDFLFSKKIASLVLVLNFFFFYQFILSSNYSVNNSPHRYYSLACSLSNTDWKICLTHAQKLQARGRTLNDKILLGKSKSVIQNVIAKEPNNFPAIIRLASISRTLGDFDTACSSYKTYFEILGFNNHLTKKGWGRFCTNHLRSKNKAK